jgi:DNA-binding MarR family transcriptional regulator
MPEPFVPLDPESQLGYLLIRCADQVARPWSTAMRAHGVNPRQFSMLAWLAQSPGISQAELARRVMVRPQSMSESLAELIEAGWITRGAAERGRAAKLRLTPKGRKLLSKAYPVVEATNRESFAALSSKEHAELALLLRKIIDTLA